MDQGLLVLAGKAVAFVLHLQLAAETDPAEQMTPL